MYATVTSMTWPYHGRKFRARRGGNYLQHTSLILDINVLVKWHLSKQGIRWPVTRPHRAHNLDLIEVICFFFFVVVVVFVFFKLSADQELVVDWIAGEIQVRHTPQHKRGLIFRAVSVARRGYTAMLRQQKLLTVDAFRVQVENGLENIFFLHFSLVSIQVWHHITVVRTHWWLRSYSSQALEGYESKAEC